MAGNLEEFIADFEDDPLGYAEECFQWGKDVLKGSTGPRTWQADILGIIGKHLQNPVTRYTPLKIAISSGRGIGKSSLIGMICQWGMSTCIDTKIVVTANTDRQLRTKTWPEISKWFKLAINCDWFKRTATTIVAAEEGHEDSWRADAYPWSSQNTEAFQGLHNINRRIILVFDEGSGVDDIIWDVSEGCLTDENTEIIWLAFSNPTRNSGRFRECFGKLRHRWITRQIDSRTVEGTNKEFFKQLVEDNGEDSDYVRVHVKGEFPRVGTMQFISSEVVEAARKREAEAYLGDPLVMGVDVARYGDDSSCIVIRRGRDARTIPWEILRGADTMTLAARVMELQNLHHCDAIFVDGGGVGGGVIDRLMMLKQNVIEVQFGGSADRSQMTGEGQVAYVNKRSEIWGYMRDWLKGGSIPDDPFLVDDLVNIQYGYAMRDGRDAIQLEKKSDLKARGFSSPDRADALALTFAYPVQPSDHTQSFMHQGSSSHQVEYNPLSRDRVFPGKSASEYDPLRRGVI